MHAETISRAKLAGLARLLGVDTARIAEVTSFEDRLRLQKAVFLLKHLGIEPFKHYDFDLYIRGPYSTELAHDYYELKDTDSAPLNLTEDVKDLLRWFIEHPMDWLEIASSIIYIKERYREISDEEVYGILRLSKPWVDSKRFAEILSELRKQGLPR